MERKPAYAAHIVSVAVPAVLLLMFMLRSHFCREWFPNMKTDSGEWDGANTFTMNLFAFMFLLSFALIPFYKRTLTSAVLLDILIGVSITDVGDRLLFHITSKTKYDFTVFLIAIFVILIDQLILRRHGKQSV